MACIIKASRALGLELALVNTKFLDQEEALVTAGELLVGLYLGNGNIYL